MARIEYVGHATVFGGLDASSARWMPPSSPFWGGGPRSEAGTSTRLELRRPSHGFSRTRSSHPLGTYFPIHPGLKGRPSFVDVPPLGFLAAVADAAPGVEVEVLRPGEAIDV